jgi:hypothetical protein
VGISASAPSTSRRRTSPAWRYSPWLISGPGHLGIKKAKKTKVAVLNPQPPSALSSVHECLILIKGNSRRPRLCQALQDALDGRSMPLSPGRGRDTLRVRLRSHLPGDMPVRARPRLLPFGCHSLSMQRERQGPPVPAGRGLHILATSAGETNEQKHNRVAFEPDGTPALSLPGRAPEGVVIRRCRISAPA